MIAAIRKARAQFSITARMDRAVQKAVAAIPETAWVSIKYPKAIFDADAAAVDLRRAGRRDHLHRVHLQGPQAPGHRPVDRPAG